MVMVKLETELAFWLDSEGVKVFVGDDESPAATMDLLELVHNEVMIYVIPASAQTFDDIEELHDDDNGIQALRDKLQEAVELLDQALALKRV